MTTRNPAVAQVIAVGAASEVSSGLAIEFVAKEPAFAEPLTERTDLPVAGLARPEQPRHLPLWTRLRLLWHRQIVRDVQ